jgi:outer membrane lipoprotein-sorting protein
MKKILFSFLIALLAVPSFAQKDAEAKSLLDHSYAAFGNAGGIRAKFSVSTFKKGKSLGGVRGSIKLKGTKFLLKTAENTIWFDGKTQWNYVYKNEEVNVSNPTATELQNINPYYILSIYRRGYNYKMGSASKFAGKAAKEIILSSQNPKQTLSNITIFISSTDYAPLFISIDRRDGSRNNLTISDFRTGQNFNDEMFVYNKKEYPKAEVVDLR